MMKTARRLSRLSLSALLLPALVTACGTNGATDVETRSVPGGGTGVLAGSWELEQVEIESHDTALSSAAIDELAILLDVNDETSSITVFTNCNTRSGSYTLDGNGAATFSLPGATRKACGEPATTLETLAVDLLEAVNTWEYEGETILLQSAEETSTLQFRPVD